MMRGDFQLAKHGFGSEESELYREYNIDVPGLPGFAGDFFDPRAQIEGGKMKFTRYPGRLTICMAQDKLISSRQDIQRLFDFQLDRMYGLIDHQMSKMGKVARDNQIVSIAQVIRQS